MNHEVHFVLLLLYGLMHHRGQVGADCFFCLDPEPGKLKKEKKERERQDTARDSSGKILG